MSDDNADKWVCPSCKTPWEWHLSEGRLCRKKPKQTSGCYENPNDPRANKVIRYVWINADHSVGRLGLLFDNKLGVVSAEGENGGPIYGSPELGRRIAERLNQ